MSMLPPEYKLLLKIWRPDMGIVVRLLRLETKVKPNTSINRQEQLARYKRWFVDGENWEGPQTEEEKVNWPDTSDISMSWGPVCHHRRGINDNQIERRLAPLELNDPLVLRWLFPLNGVPHSQVKLHGSRRMWMKHDALSKRLETLEARIKPIDPTADFLAQALR